jgi:putative transposase
MKALLHFLALIVRSAPALFRSRKEQAIVELALRQQLATLSQKKSKPKITPIDRVFWIALFRFWPRWKRVLVIVKPDTVVRWHRKGFRLYWRWISKRGPGRPPLPAEVQTLIKRFVLDNSWGARKVHAELGKLGFMVSLATVSRYMPKRPHDKGKQQRWMTFLRNHKDGIAAMDFFVVPTITFCLLYVWFIIDHERRRIIHVNVTPHPTSKWVVQQIRESFPDDLAPNYLVFDNDTIFSREVSTSIRSLGITPKETAHYS